MGKFKKGLFLGSLLGAGLTWLSVTKKGKEVREKLLDQSAEVYGMVKEKVTDSEVWEKMTKQKYVAMVSDIVEKYGLKNGLGRDIQKMIKKVVSAQWVVVKKEMSKRKK